MNKLIPFIAALLPTYLAVANDSNIIEDKFTDSINANWNIINKVETDFSVNSGKLALKVQPENIWSDLATNPKNVFLMDATTTSYQTQVSVSISPFNDYEQAGIGVYWDDDNYIKISNEMFEGKHSIVFVTEKEGIPVVNRRLDLDYDDIDFRLTRTHDSISAFYKHEHSKKWRKVMSVPAIAGVEKGVMLYTFSGKKNKGNWATFDNFKLTY